MPVIPALWEAKAGGSPEVRSLRLAWPTWWNPASTKNIKISWAWWRVPVIPATQKAMAELVEPGRQRLQWAEIAPLNSSLGDTARLHLKKNKIKQKTFRDKEESKDEYGIYNITLCIHFLASKVSNRDSRTWKKRVTQDRGVGHLGRENNTF